MFNLKPISRDSIETALAKAERYRLLNEPNEAESICRDILEIDSANRQARISLVLALEFGQLLMLKYTNWKSNGYRAFS